MVYRNGDPMEDVSPSRLWKAKYIYESIYDTYTDKKKFILGRPSLYVPLSAVIGAAMVTYNRYIFIFPEISQKLFGN